MSEFAAYGGLWVAALCLTACGAEAPIPTAPWHLDTTIAPECVAPRDGGLLADAALEGDAHARTDAGPTMARDTAATDGADATTAQPPNGLLVIDVHLTDQAWTTLHADPQGTAEVDCTVHVGGVAHAGASLELHGGFARTVPKKSYRVKLAERDDGSDPEVDLFGEGPERTRRFVLQAAWIDPTYLRNKLTLDLIRAFGGLAPRVTFATVCFNGRRHGFYTLIERVDRVYLRKQGLAPRANLYKAENHYANWTPHAEPIAGYDRQLVESAEPHDLMALLTTLATAPADEAGLLAAVSPWLDLHDHHVFTMVRAFAMDQDTFTKNYYLHHDPAGMRVGPDGPADIRDPGAPFRIISWDADATFALNWDGAPLPADTEKWYGHDAFSPRLYGLPGVRRAHLEALAAALEHGPLRLSALRQRVEADAARIAEAARDDAQRWERPTDFTAEIGRLTDALETRHRVTTALVARLLAELPR